jgi:RNA polymerase sigma factor (sigma-70 family)
MQELDDAALLREYVERDSEEAFAALVTRHVNKVYSVALRHTGNPHSAEEITQAVFVILAKKSRHLGKRVILSGWLYQTARLTAVTFIRGRIRRARREQEAYMQTALNENESDLSRRSETEADAIWKQFAPLLDAAMAGLNETDRHAVVLRFFDGKNLREVGAALGANEDAAKKRVSRALEKLRTFFARRGVSSTTAIIAGAISANSVQAAPVALAKSVTAIAVAKGAAASGSTLTLIKGALKIMAWTKAKTAVVVGVASILAVGTATPIVIHHYKAKATQISANAEQAMASLFTSKTELSDTDNANYRQLTGTTPAEMAQNFFDACSREDWSTVGKFWPDNTLKDGTKKYLGGMEVISLGKPFKARISIAALLELQPNLRDQFRGMGNQKDFQGPQVYVPYEIRLKDGNVKKWQLAIRCDNPDHRWYFDGGL